ncbi:MAG TPA: succinate dehydrogenase [Nitrososphaeraceae archaeon]|nr:succinate dehydrogenase [Nitrososphaeraceae archaeon]
MERHTLLKESQIMKIHYITGIAAIFVVALHIMMRLVVPFELSLEYDYIIANYRNIVYVLILESILILISVHGFNGIRIILLELRQSKAWENMITVVTISAMIALIAYGTRTVILANGL